MPFTLGFLDLPTQSYAWFSKPDPNSWLTRQPHGLYAFWIFLLFLPFPFFIFFFFSLLFHPGIFPPLHFQVSIPSCWGHFSSWPWGAAGGGAGLLTECCSVLWTMWMQQPALAHSNLGEAGQDLLCRRGQQKKACALLTTEAKYPAHRWH